MKIVHVITRFVRGGADENTLLSCNAQAAAGDEVHLIYGGEFSLAMLARLDGRVKLHKVSSMVRPVRPVNDFAAAFALVKILRNISPDIVHTHTSKAGALGRLAAFIVRVPIIVHGVHILPFDNVPWIEKAVYLVIERALAPITHAFINVSEGMQDLGIRYGVGRSDRHFVVPSGMDTKLFREAVPFTIEELNARIPAVHLGPLLVFTAALEPRKRQYEFLDVFAKVHHEVPAAQLVLLGEGHDEARLRDRVTLLGLGDAVHFAGYTDEVHRWIASAAVCVFASEREGLPRAVVQYVLGSRPVVSTRLPGIEIVVEDGVSGHLTSVATLSDMVDPIVSILSSREFAEAMASAARERDLSAWDQTAMAEELAAIYLSLQAKTNERHSSRAAI